MSNLQDRCGSVVIRLGGNTQEYAAMVPINSISGGKSFAKADSGKNSTVSRLPVSLLRKTIFYRFSLLFTDPDAGRFVYDRYVLHDV